jgi:2-C-methyl-D-erythritol 2,4-cyclodiphosphate synthase
MRTGIGYDIHRLIPTTENSTIPIGGFAIPCRYKIQAHSDGDVLLHAIVDSMLGALALGDIGQWFPNHDPRHHNRKSSEFVTSVLEKIKEMGWRIVNVDSVVIAEEPKILPHSDKIRECLAHMLKTELSCVSVKAKTMEGLGPIGERKAISAYAVVNLELIV